jgi:hypothetical protein
MTHYTSPWRIAPLLLLALVAACQDKITDPNNQVRPRVQAGAAPLLVASQHRIQGEYIVVYKDDIVQTAASAAATTQMVLAHGGRVRRTYQHTIKGFAATLPPAAVEVLRQDPRVAYPRWAPSRQPRA